MSRKLEKTMSHEELVVQWDQIIDEFPSGLIEEVYNSFEEDEIRADIKALYDILIDSINNLPDNQRLVIIEWNINCRRYRKIADILSMPVNEVRNLHALANANLRRECYRSISEKGGTN